MHGLAGAFEDGVPEFALGIDFAAALGGEGAQRVGGQVAADHVHHDVDALALRQVVREDRVEVVLGRSRSRHVGVLDTGRDDQCGPHGPGRSLGLGEVDRRLEAAREEFRKARLREIRQARTRDGSLDPEAQAWLRQMERKQ